MSRPNPVLLVVLALFVCGSMGPGLQADTQTKPAFPAPPAPSIDAARSYRPVERKLPPLGTKTPQKYEIPDMWPDPPIGPAPSLTSNPPMSMQPRSPGGTMPRLPDPTLPTVPGFGDPYTKAGFGVRGSIFISGPYLKSAQLKTLNHQGLLPSAVPTPAANYRRYFIFVQVMPAVSKIWVVAPKSVQPTLLFDHLMRLPYNKDMERHTYVIQDHNYTVAMITKNSTRFGLRSYREALPLEQILQMLQKQGIEKPGIVKVSKSAKMLPALNPDQQTPRSNIYDLSRHPELGHMVVSVKLTTADYWPLLCLLVAPLFVVIVSRRVLRTSELPDKERKTEAGRIYVRTMLAAIVLIIAAFMASLNAQLSLYAMWFRPGLVVWAVAVPLVVSLLVPIAGYWILQNMVRSRLLDATDRLAAYPEVQRMRAQHWLIEVGNFIVMMALVFYLPMSVLYSSLPGFIIELLVVFLANIGVTVLLRKRENAILPRLIPTYADDYKERLSKLQCDLTALAALRGIRSPSIKLVNSLDSYRVITVLLIGNEMSISRLAFDTLSDDELKFLTSASLLNEERKWIRVAQNLIGFAFFAVVTLLLPSSLEPIPFIIVAGITLFGIPYFLGVMRSRVADRLAVNLIGNPAAAISALRKIHEAAPGNWAIKVRLRALEASAQTDLGRPPV